MEVSIYKVTNLLSYQRKVISQFLIEKTIEIDTEVNSDLRVKSQTPMQGEQWKTELQLYYHYTKEKKNIIFPNKPTHYPINKMIPTIIDIGFAKNVTSLPDLTVLQELNSYHYPVFFTTGVITRNNMTRQMNDYATAD
ncbi:hypothetical protein HZH66_010527 [Vespula vulgaris]|uniref:Uncharacterized protein n=1 Tax=Vespula vulgaris TaxID=7454 RepID=A0A834JGQ9_VESVU|nr:hypothetical protein HZH66_010527 [Vespula vulgaris]